MKIRVPCPDCHGKGILPSLGNPGEKDDIRRFFPRPCDRCNCAGFVMQEFNPEDKPTAYAADLVYEAIQRRRGA